MTVRIVKAARWPRWPGWFYAVLAAWAGLGALAWALGLATGHALTLCPLKRLTGLPCPTCGSTRALMSLLGGNLAGAWRFNPLLIAAVALAVLYPALRVVAGRGVTVSLSRRERTAAAVLAVCLVAANWAYVILAVG